MPLLKAVVAVAAELAAPRSRAGRGVLWGSCTVSQPAKTVPQTSPARAQSGQQPLRMGSASTQSCWLWTLQNVDEYTGFNGTDTSLHIQGTDEWEHCPVAVRAGAALPLSPHSWEGAVFCHALRAEPGISVCTANEDWLGCDLLEKLPRYRCVPFPDCCWTIITSKAAREFEELITY